MSNKDISKEELTKKRTPSELHSWLNRRIEQIGSTDEGLEDLRLHRGLAKQLMEEVYPLALFGCRKFGNNDQILMQPIIGNQNYDAVVTDLRTKPASQSYVEITQSHEGENDYLRMVALHKHGYVFKYGTVSKTGTQKTGLEVSVQAEAVEVAKVAKNELGRILDALKRKAGKDYPANTSLIIIFDDTLHFQEVVDSAKLDNFVNTHILTLDLKFSTLYLVGQKNVFREFSISKGA
ncbi:MAG: hypothetical protein HQ588_05095 [Deltaproteobacteria bacterium]|nr:hypothetical protein [Deltaproteobacteria bacterium]